MNLYNKYYENCFDEIITWYPTFYRDVYKMVEILKAQGKLADDLENGIESVFFNQFIDTADENVISYYESLMDITPDTSSTLEERRRVVKAHLVGSGRLSASLICSMIEAYTGEKAECRLEAFDTEKNNMLYIDTDRSGSSIISLESIYSVLSKKLPAHVMYQLAFQYDCGIPLVCDVSAYLTEIPKAGQLLCGQYPSAEVIF